MIFNLDYKVRHLSILFSIANQVSLVVTRRFNYAIKVRENVFQKQLKYCQFQFLSTVYQVYDYLFLIKLKIIQHRSPDFPPLKID